MLTLRSIASFGATTLEISCGLVPPIRSPLMKTALKPVVHAQLPTFLSRQILSKLSPGVRCIPSGTVTSITSSARSTQVVSDSLGVSPGGGVGVHSGPSDGGRSSKSHPKFSSWTVSSDDNTTLIDVKPSTASG